MLLFVWVLLDWEDEGSPNGGESFFSWGHAGLDSPSFMGVDDFRYDQDLTLSARHRREVHSHTVNKKKCTMETCFDYSLCRFVSTVKYVELHTLCSLEVYEKEKVDSKVLLKTLMKTIPSVKHKLFQTEQQVFKTDVCQMGGEDMWLTSLKYTVKIASAIINCQASFIVVNVITYIIDHRRLHIFDKYPI